MTHLSGHSKLDVKIVALGIILSCGVVYAIYSTVRHFYVLNQVNEAKEMMSDIQSKIKSGRCSKISLTFSGVK
jgi:hypothetical protein